MEINILEYNMNDDEEMETFDWALTKAFKVSIFEKLKMRERVDIKLVLGFINKEMGINFANVRRYAHLVQTYKNEKEQITHYRDLYDYITKNFTTSYALAKHKWGRVNPTNHLSLCIFHRPTRHRLARDEYVDIDMINAQPTLISNVCRMNNIKCPSLDEYVADHKKGRKDIMTHHNCKEDVAKQLPIILMFGGRYTTWLKEYSITTNADNLMPSYKTIETEMDLITEVVYMKNPLIYKDVLKKDPSKWKDISAIKRGVIALWAQTVERLLQEKAIMWLVKNKDFKLEDIIPCQDGFMILKELNYPDIINDINAIMTLGMKFKIKEFDEAMEIEPYENGMSVEEWNDLLSVKRLADTFITTFGDNIVSTKNELFIFKDGRWYDETDTKNRKKLTIMISEDLYKIVAQQIKGAIELKEAKRNAMLEDLRKDTSRNMSDIVMHILSKTRMCDGFNKDPLILGFENGVYDLRISEFRERRFDDYITLSTGYDYEEYDENDDEKMEKLREFFHTIQPDDEMLYYLLQVLASGLDGIGYEQIFMFNGRGGNGKGVVSKLMEKILGKSSKGGYFHQPTNGILKDMEKANAPSPDIYNLKNVRYLNYTECEGRLGISIIRNMTGGGSFQGRLLHQNPEDIYITATQVMEFNNPPELTGKIMPADYRRYRDLDFPVVFTTDKEKWGKVINGVLHQEANDYYKSSIFLEENKKIFLQLLLNIYKENFNEENGRLTIKIPERIVKRTAIFLENQNVFLKIFNGVWETSDETLKENKKGLKELWDSVSQSEEYRQLHYNQKKIYGRDEFYKWCDDNYKVIHSTKGKFINGLSRKVEEYDFEDATTEII